MIAFLQVAGAVPTSTIELITTSGLETKIVLVILVVLSLVSWAIMFGVGRERSALFRMGSPTMCFP